MCSVMKRFFSKHQILTIPNLLSLVRIALIPLIVWLYSGKSNYAAAIGVILLSGATDVVDGWIARRFNMISDFGKALDPLADKLTQAALLLCLLSRYSAMWWLIPIFGVCEISKLALAIALAQKRDTVTGAMWYGKANTVVIYTVMMLLILFPEMKSALAGALIGFCGIVMIFAHVLYVRLYVGILLRKGKDKKVS